MAITCIYVYMDMSGTTCSVCLMLLCAHFQADHCALGHQLLCSSLAKTTLWVSKIKRSVSHLYSSTLLTEPSPQPSASFILRLRIFPDKLSNCKIVNIVYKMQLANTNTQNRTLMSKNRLAWFLTCFLLMGTTKLYRNVISPKSDFETKKWSHATQHLCSALP